jgi:hypothetical protein
MLMTAAVPASMLAARLSIIDLAQLCVIQKALATVPFSLLPTQAAMLEL